MTPYLLILLLILIALAAPAGIAELSWSRFLVGLVTSFFIVVLPLFVFFFSSFKVLELEWKGACQHGWLDCFIVGKVALTPFVVVGAAALYKADVLRVKVATEQWIVVGTFLGAVVATACLVFGLVCIGLEKWMLVPGYVAVWYSIRAAQLMRKAQFKSGTYFTALLGTIPFWLASWWWSRTVFESLPNEAPKGCFIVTAACRGHQHLVGPFSEVQHNGRKVRANRQLQTFWQFEKTWHEQLPLSHNLFRNIYNRVGPVIAGRIQSSWMADAVYLALKPMEIVARQINRQIKEHYELQQMD